MATAYKIPSETTNQESGYFSIIEGHNGRIYIGTAKYGENGYLVEFDPKKQAFRTVVDVQNLIDSKAKGFAAQAKIHTRNNVGESGKIYCGSKQGYTQQGEKLTDYPGGYVITYDPKTDKAEHYGIAVKHHGIISVTPDEGRGIAYISTCDDGRPDESSHFMILDLKTKKYRDLGDMKHSYAFIVIDYKGRAYHPTPEGKIARFDPTKEKLEILPFTIDGKPPAPDSLLSANHPLNWDISHDRKTLYNIPMSENMLYAFDLTAEGGAIPGRRIGRLLKDGGTDCRAMCVGPKGTLWAAVKGDSRVHLLSYTTSGEIRDHGTIGIGNPDFTPFKDKEGKALPWHHCVAKTSDGVLFPTVPMGICQARGGAVYVTTISPFVLLEISPDTLKLK